MTAMTVKRTIRKRPAPKQSVKRRSSSELFRRYLANERKLEFAIEALLFGIIIAISAWPMFAAADALAEFLHLAPV